MAIYVTGDVHGKMGMPRIEAFLNRVVTVQDCDYLIIAGDFGLVWNNTKEENLMLNYLDTLPIHILFIDGNHENFHLLNQYPITTWHGGKVHKIRSHVIHLMRGQIFTIEDNTIFTFGGAKSIDKEYRTEFISWWPEELPSSVEYDEGLENLARVNNRVDYIITHTCSQEILADLEELMPIIDICDPVCKYLQQFEDSVVFQHWYFGHFHLDCTNIYHRHTALFNQFVKL